MFDDDDDDDDDGQLWPLLDLGFAAGKNTDNKYFEECMARCIGYTTVSYSCVCSCNNIRWPKYKSVNHQIVFLNGHACLACTVYCTVQYTHRKCREAFLLPACPPSATAQFAHIISTQP